MAARLVPARGTAVLFGAFVVLSTVVSFDAANAAPVVVVGSIKCLDCSPDDANAEDAFKGRKHNIYDCVSMYNHIKEWGPWEDELRMNQHTVSAKEYCQFLHFSISHLNSVGTRNRNAKRDMKFDGLRRGETIAALQVQLIAYAASKDEQLLVYKYSERFI